MKIVILLVIAVLLLTSGLGEFLAPIFTDVVIWFLLIKLVRWTWRPNQKP